MGKANNLNTVIDGFELDLAGQVYSDVHGKLFIEVRDFGLPNRTMIIRTMIEGIPVTTEVSWEMFTDAFDSMRGRMLGDDWDTALSVLTGRSV